MTTDWEFVGIAIVGLMTWFGLIYMYFQRSKGSDFDRTEKGATSVVVRFAPRAGEVAPAETTVADRDADRGEAAADSGAEIYVRSRR